VGGNHDVLREVLRYAAADHQQARGRVLDLDLRQLVEVLARINGAMRLALARMHVRHDAEAERAVRERRAEDRHVLLVAGEHDRVSITLLRRAAVLLQVAAHLADELARAVGSGLHRVDDLLGRLVADAELFLVDERVVDAVDHQLAQLGIARAVLVLVAGDVVAETKRLEEVLVDDVRAGRDDGIDHVVAHEVDDDLLQARRDERAGEAKDDAAVGIAQHHVINVGRTREIARAVGHRSHRVHQRHNVVLGDVDVLNLVFEEFLFGSHNQLPVYRASASNYAGLLQIWRETQASLIRGWEAGRSRTCELLPGSAWSWLVVCADCDGFHSNAIPRITSTNAKRYCRSVFILEGPLSRIILQQASKLE